MKKYRSYRKSETTTIGDAIGDMMRQFNISGQFDEKRLIESWGKVMGPVVENRTKRLFMKKKVLFVELTSAPLKKELTMSKSKVMDLLSEKTGAGIVEDIVFL